MGNILKIIKISRPLHGLFTLIGILILLSSTLTLVAPILSKLIVDEIVRQIETQRGNIQNLGLLIALAFGANFLGLSISVISNRLGDHLAGKLRKFLVEKFYDKVLRLPQSYFDSEISGKIINQLNRGIQVTQDFVNTSTNFILPSVIQGTFTIVVLFFYSSSIAIFVSLLYPVYITLSYYSTKKWGAQEVEKNRIEDITRGRMTEVILNMPLVKSFTQEASEFKFISQNLSSINKIYAKQSQTYHIYDFFRELSLHIVLLLVSIVVFVNTFKGSLSIGEMVLILQLTAQARLPLFAMSFILTRIQAAEAGSREYFEVLELTSQEKYDSDVVFSKIKNPQIRFKNVSFKYEKSENVLKNVSFEIGNKETVALVGHSGAGKTTIVNLIIKFYTQTSGDVYLNDKNYKDLDHKFIRNNISLVFQENELFSSTIRENVLYGKENATKRGVVNALKLANAYDFIQKLPKGLDNEVGERGVKLSGGQKQRIQIARAILKDAPILILDEATSSLDAKSEKEVQGALANLMRDKLVIIIAHRFSTIQNVDRILVVDDGKIVEQGSPPELAKKPGIYSELLHYQIEGNKKLLEKFDIF